MTIELPREGRHLQALEELQQAWHNERNVFQRLLVRTSLASEGINPQLDQLMEELRQLARKQEPDLVRMRALQGRLDQLLIALDDEPEPASPERQSLLSRLFKRKAEDGRGASILSELQHDADADAASDEEAEGAQRLRIARRVAELVDHLLTKASLPASSRARATVLRDRLSSSNDWDILRDALNELADLIIAVVSRGEAEFSAFLRRLDERLVSLQESCAYQLEAAENRRCSSAQLDETVTTNLQALGEDLRTATDLDTLKQSVNSHIEQVATVIRCYREEEDKRDALLAEKMAAMKEKLAALEAHSEQVQEQLREERQRALTDVLTQLPNREAWDERLRFEFARWKRYQHPTALVIADIDHFKKVNDTYGHKSGDRVLQLVAQTLRERLRDTDFIARYGGEEFVILLPETSVDDAVKVMNGLREHVARLPFHFKNQPVSVTISAGLAPLSSADDPVEVFDLADKLLYEAKQQGRNRVVSASG
ncbi:MAG: diguanylate cyclase [Marinobacter sp.]|nr:diguanylate cyclase [Marinobacter sp.]